MNHEEQMLHLLRRTGFGTSKKKVTELSSLSIEEAVHSIVDQKEEVWEFSLDLVSTNQNELTYWWYNLILTTPNSFQELMTLFWHNHFTTSLNSVNPSEMYVQNQLLRSYSLGNFKRFLYDISIDPAMLKYLNNQSNIAKLPNENYAREFLELFTVGRENYTQEDVMNVARSITGWRYNSRSDTVYFDASLFDKGIKQVLTKRGNFDLEDIVRIVASTRECAEFIVRKIWSKFVFPNPTDSEIAPFVDVFRENGLEIKPLLKAIFTSDLFYSPKARLSIYKNPTEYVIEMLRHMPKYEFSINDLSIIFQMGMPLMKPPNVGGWKENENWLSASYLFARGIFAARVANQATYESMALEKTDNKSLLIDQVLEQVGMYDISQTSKDAMMDYANTTTDPLLLLRGLLYLIFVSPDFQIK